MTTLEIRDELAQLEGWAYTLNGFWEHEDFRPRESHPIPDTLDEAAKLPEGWTWQCNDHYWFAFWPINPFGKPGVTVARTGNELHDRFALRLECERATRKER